MLERLILLGDLEDKGNFASLPFRIAVPGITGQVHLK